MILRTALSESPIASLKFEHLSNQRTKTTLWLVRDTYSNAAIWLVRDTYPKRSDWCEQHTTLCTLTEMLFFLIKTKKSKNSIHVQHFFNYWRWRNVIEALSCLIKALVSYFIISGVHRSRISVWRPCTPGGNSTRMYFFKCQGNCKEKGYIESAVIFASLSLLWNWDLWKV